MKVTENISKSIGGLTLILLNNLDWLLNKTRNTEDKQILAVVKEPELDCSVAIQLEGFQFCGYDLVEDFTRISALTNCGGFDKAFSACEISRYGLIEDF